MLHRACPTTLQLISLVLKPFINCRLGNLEKTAWNGTTVHINSIFHVHSFCLNLNQYRCCCKTLWPQKVLTSFCRHLHFWLLLKMVTLNVSPFCCRMEAMCSKGTTKTETVSWLPFKITTSMAFTSSHSCMYHCTCKYVKTFTVETQYGWYIGFLPHNRPRQFMCN